MGYSFRSIAAMIAAFGLLLASAGPAAPCAKACCCHSDRGVSVVDNRPTPELTGYGGCRCSIGRTAGFEPALGASEGGGDYRLALEYASGFTSGVSSRSLGAHIPAGAHRLESRGSPPVYKLVSSYLC